VIRESSAREKSAKVVLGHVLINPQIGLSAFERACRGRLRRVTCERAVLILREIDL